MLKQGLVAVFVLSHQAALAEQHQAQSRPATLEELTQNACDDSRFGLRVLQVDPERSKPFELLSCNFLDVEWRDCNYLQEFLYEFPETFLLSGINVFDSDVVRGIHDYLGPTYDEHCEAALG